MKMQQMPMTNRLMYLFSLAVIASAAIMTLSGLGLIIACIVQQRPLVDLTVSALLTVASVGIFIRASTARSGRR